MRIAQISPLIESVPPQGYGGTERVVSYLTEELVKSGHDVTLFATADSKTSARLIPVSPQGLRLYESKVDPLAYHFIQLEEVVSRASQFDLLHFHTDYLHFPVSRRCKYAHLTTLHGRLDLTGLHLLYKRYNDMPLVSISNSQRKPIPEARWLATVYHGLPTNMYKPVIQSGSYLAFLGRISEEKRVDRAIEIAKRTGMPLKIAAKVDAHDQEYYESQIKHLFDHPLVEYIGEIGEGEKAAFLGNAAALIFPIDWPEPFGLVMIEAMACGTPVIAYRRGSVPEIINHGVTGYVVSTIDEAVKSVENLHSISRKLCRKEFEERFGAEVMSKNYEEVYEKILHFQKPRTLYSHQAMEN